MTMWTVAGSVRCSGKLASSAQAAAQRYLSTCCCYCARSQASASTSSVAIRIERPRHSYRPPYWTTTRRTYSTSTHDLHTTRTAPVPDRSVIAIEGRDTIKLLQGLTTNNIRAIPPDQSIYCAFLNPQGRMICTAFIFQPQDGTALVDVDSRVAASLLAFIKRFKLRSKVTLRDATDEYAVHAVWGSEAKAPEVANEVVASARDSRTPDMGYRFLCRRDQASSSDIAEASSQQYTIHRLLQGVPESITDTAENHALPLEANVDFMGGVDFRKGCYVGQELTARTHHTGVVRKRIVPVCLYPDKDSSSSSDIPEPYQVDTQSSLVMPQTGEEVRSIPINDQTARGKSAGKFLSGVHNVGLALLRLDQVHRWNKDFLMKVKVGDEQHLLIRPWLPAWWPEEAKKPLEQ